MSLGWKFEPNRTLDGAKLQFWWLKVVVWSKSLVGISLSIATPMYRAPTVDRGYDE